MPENPSPSPSPPARPFDPAGGYVVQETRTADELWLEFEPTVNGVTPAPGTSSFWPMTVSYPDTPVGRGSRTRDRLLLDAVARYLNTGGPPGHLVDLVEEVANAARCGPLPTAIPGYHLAASFPPDTELDAWTHVFRPLDGLGPEWVWYEGLDLTQEWKYPSDADDGPRTGRADPPAALAAAAEPPAGEAGGLAGDDA